MNAQLGEDIDETNVGPALLLRLQRRLKQLEQENKIMNEEIINSSKSAILTDKHSSWHLDQLEVEKLKHDFKLLREQILKGDEQAAKEQLMGKIYLLVSSLSLISVSI